MSYQGVLRTGPDEIAPDGNHNITFRIYDVPNDGAALWTEAQLVQVANGRFNVILGSQKSLSELLFNEQYYLGVQVGLDPELEPRIQLAASPYSLGWRGGTVCNTAAFQDTVYAHILNVDNRVLFEDPDLMIRWTEGPGGQRRAYMNGDGISFLHPCSSNERTIELSGASSEGGASTMDLTAYDAQCEEVSNIHLVTTAVGDARVQLDSQSVSNAVYIIADEDEGGCGIIELKNASGTVTIELNGCTGKLTAKDSAGRVTIELDPETGDIYYTGELKKR